MRAVSRFGATDENLKLKKRVSLRALHAFIIVKIIKLR